MRLAISHAVRRLEPFVLGNPRHRQHRGDDRGRNIDKERRAANRKRRPAHRRWVGHRDRDCPAIDSPPSTRPGGSLSPPHGAARMITIAAGYPAEVRSDQHAGYGRYRDVVRDNRR